MTNEQAQTIRFDVAEAHHGERLDKWLTRMLEEEDLDVSRSQVQTWIDEGFVTGPKARVKANERVESGAAYTVLVPEPEPVDIVPESIPLHVVYEDEHVVVVDKPRGLVVHPAAGHASGTVINGLAGRGTPLSSLGGAMRPGVVHRIDKDTSGLVVFAKTDQAYHALSEQLREHTMDRLYLAIAHGVVEPDRAVIDAPIGRDPDYRQRMAVVSGGKPSVTHLRVLERFTEYTFLELQLETGRTHQIRVHLAYIQHPLAGDPLYGRGHTLPIDGQALHAASLGFQHPTRDERLHFESPLPDDMERLLAELRQLEASR